MNSINLTKTTTIIVILAIIIFLTLFSVDVYAAAGDDIFAKGDTKITTITEGVKKWVIGLATLIFIASALMMRKGMMNNETFKGVTIGCVVIGLAPDAVIFLTS